MAGAAVVIGSVSRVQEVLLPGKGDHRGDQARGDCFLSFLNSLVFSVFRD